MRIAIGGFMLESNSHAPVSTREEFEKTVLLEGDAILADLARENPISPPPLTGFAAEMDRLGAWDKVPTIMAAVGASGSVDQPFFDWVVARMEDWLKRAGKLDGVFLSQHGAAIGTVDPDPDATFFKAVRKIVGPNVPVVATLDLHANVSRAMVEAVDVLVSYRENPHVDMAARGADCARHLRRLMGGFKVFHGFQKLRLAPPSVTQLTKSGPYHDIIAMGQKKVGGAGADEVIDVSVLSGFTTGDTPKNGMSVIVTAASRPRAEAVAREVATYAWSQRQRFIPKLTSLEDSTRMALDAGAGKRAPLLFADVADNPGGGGRGNTTHILAAFHEAGVQGAALGPFFDPPLAAEATKLGVGASFTARFNRDEKADFSDPFTAPARVKALHKGIVVGRHGMAEGRTVDFGPSALITVGGIDVVVGSIRHQALDPAFFEFLGVDLAKTRVVVVKSRGHFRAGFDIFFPDDRIIEVDVPGLTTPVLARVKWRHMPRPMYPLDPDTQWAPA